METLRRLATKLRNLATQLTHHGVTKSTLFHIQHLLNADFPLARIYASGGHELDRVEDRVKDAIRVLSDKDAETHSSAAVAEHLHAAASLVDAFVGHSEIFLFAQKS